jgi:hypothetical protein
MKKPEPPYMEYFPQNPPEFEEKILDTKLFVDSDCQERFIESWQDENNTEEEPVIEDWNYDNVLCSLQDILDKAPSNIDPKNIIVSIQRDRDRDHITYTLSYKVMFDAVAWQLKKDQAKAEYDIKLENYKKLKHEYDIWLAEKELSYAQEKLDKLKK